MVQIQCEHKEIIFVVVAVLLIFFLVKRKNMKKHNNKRQLYYENLENTSVDDFNPKLFQRDIANRADDDNYIPLPNNAESPWDVNAKGYGEGYALEPVEYGLNYNMCSKSCCSQPYPPPFALKPDEFIKKSGKKFVPSPYTCNNGWQDSGCLCLEPKQSVFLNKRGNNRLGGDEF
jgi:hypothetical protein